MSLTAAIVGVSGLELTREETSLLAAGRPAGLILFARNCASGQQIQDLVAAFKAAVRCERTLVLIDQEGGRVQRLKPPIATLLPAAGAFLGMTGGDVVAAARLVRLAAQLAATELKALGINTNCAPVLDVPVAGAHDIIGNRAFAQCAATVAALGTAASDGLMAGGVLPVIKHIPGHGRAGADSHLELPVVNAPLDELEQSDFAAFRWLAHLPAAMTAHVVYPAVDESAPASTSARVTRQIIRGSIGFQGLLMSDDLGMRALSGSFGDRARAVIGAGSDVVLHCSGNACEMNEVLEATPGLAGLSLDRYVRALAVAETEPMAFDMQAAREWVARLLAIGA